MAKSIPGGVEIVNTLSTKNDGNYPLVKAESVGMADGTTAEDNIKKKLDKNQGTQNNGKFMRVGADGNLVPDDVPIPDVSGQIKEHNENTDSHQDIRTELKKKANSGTTLSDYGITDAVPDSHLTDSKAHEDIRKETAKLKTRLAEIDSLYMDTIIDKPHELLTETTPIGTYGNTCANEFIWIPSKVFIPKGSKGVVKIVSCTEGASYKFFTLKKNTESNFTIVDTYNHDVNANVNIDYYEVSAIEHDVYFGFYSSNKGIAYSSSQTNELDSLVRAHLTDSSSGTFDVSVVSTNLNFSYELTIETKKGKSDKLYGYIVDKNGSGDFTTINEAIDSTNDGDTIYIKSGIYNEKVKMWGKNRHLIGESKHNTFIVSTSRLYNNEPLQANMGTIENITLIGGYGLNPIEGYTQSASYAIHIEYPNESPHELVIDNCNIISNLAPAIGIGVRYNQKVTIKNCYIETKAKEMYSSAYSNYFNCGAVFCHNDPSGLNLGTDGYISVENCELKGVTTALTLQSQNNGNTLTHRFLKNTLWSTENGTKNAITLRTEATSGHLVGSDGVLDTISFGNNATELNA